MPSATSSPWSPEPTGYEVGISAFVGGWRHGEHTMMDPSTLRSIVDLVPRYAHARRIAIERDDAAPIPAAELRATLANPYGIVEYDLTYLPQLVARGLLDQVNERYALAPAGHALLKHAERAANDYAVTRYHQPPDDLARLALTLHTIAERQRQAVEPADKPQQDRVPRLRRFDPRETPPVVLEYALYALQRARDDAHIAAWRAVGLRGAALDLLSRLWAGDATTIAELVDQTRDRMRKEDVAARLDELACDGLVTLQGPAVAITRQGRTVRAAIERETDRVYFAPWPEIDAAWVHNRLAALAASFSS